MKVLIQRRVHTAFGVIFLSLEAFAYIWLFALVGWRIAGAILLTQVARGLVNANSAAYDELR